MPSVGDFGLVKINGSAGVFIRIGQWLCGKGFADYEHALVCVGLDNEYDGAAIVIEAEPGGALLNHYSVRGGVLWSQLDLTDTQRTAIAQAAMKLRGVPYSFLDYVALALHTWHVPAPFLKRYISSTHHMICSQLVDQVYRDAGVELFKDGRWPGYVMPADLYNLIK